MAYKSKLEEAVAAELKGLKVKANYEPSKLPYVLERNYIPDWVVPSSGIILEAKGKLDPDSRAKMKAVKKKHPHLDIRFIFSKANNKLNRNSKTTYGEWATKNGFKWCEVGSIPKKWFK